MIENPLIQIPGDGESRGSILQLDEGIMDKHILVIGSTGTGKTNFINHALHDIKRRMTDNDVMVVFDTKGDYHNLFYDEKKDAIIGNSEMYRDVSERWNIFKEMLVDGCRFETYDQYAREISNCLFKDQLEETGTNSFFPRAASDLFGSVLSAFVKRSRMDPRAMAETLHNLALREFMDAANVELIAKLLQADRSYDISRFYLGDGTSEQGLGVMSVMESTVRPVLQGIFAKDGRFSIRRFIREKKGRTLFIEYDLAVGGTLTPVYRLLIDLALKEALSRSSNEGNVYIVCDEFKLLPHVEHMDDAVNLGRSLGVKVIAGIQSVNQLYDNYGEYRGKNIAAGFSSIVAFRTTDSESREFVSGRFGKTMVTDTVMTGTGTSGTQAREGMVVEDWDLSGLRPLQAVVGLAFREPFVFRFRYYS